MTRRRKSIARAASAPARNNYRPNLDLLENRLPPGDALLSLLSAVSVVSGTMPVIAPSNPQHQISFQLDSDLVIEPLAFDLAGSADVQVIRKAASVATNDAESETNPEIPLPARLSSPIARSSSAMGLGHLETSGSISITAPLGVMAETSVPLNRSARIDAAPSLRKSALTTNKPPQVATQSRAPVSFEANVGQTDASVHFLSRGAGYNLFLTLTEAVVSMRTADSADNPAVVRMQYLGANPTPQVLGKNESATKVNYFHGRDSSQWQHNVSTYGQVAYHGLYAGIDLVYYGNSQHELEYDFIVAPGADPSVIKLSFEGADHMQVDEGGNLVLQIGAHQLRQKAPVTYQEVNGQRHAIPSAYVQDGTRISFAVGNYDTARPLIIDPVVSYSGYHGGNNTDSAESVTVDATGNAYVVGWTNSTNFPSQNGAQKSKAGLIDAFLTKFTPQGTIAFSTYFGGEGSDYIRGVAVDSAGTIHIAGNTSSKSTLPLLNPLQGHYNRGKWDAFVAKLNSTGTLTYSSYLGGTGEDFARGIVIDAAGSMYVTGQTDSVDFPKVNAWQSTLGGIQDAFVAKLSADGQSIAFSTYLGGIQNDIAYDIALDGSGNIHIAGHTVSTNFPTVSPFQPTYGGGFFDGFVAKLNPAGGVVFSSFLGGNDLDRAFGVAVDPAGNAYYAGQTWSVNFPTLNALQPNHGGNTDIFVTKVTAAGVRVYSTYVGGNSAELIVGGLDVNSAGAVFVAGGTESVNFPTAQPLQATKKELRDAFITVINPAGNALTFSTYYGGNAYDEAANLDVDAAGNMYVVGSTYSTNFPLVNPWQPNKNTFTDGFVMKIAP